MPDYKFTSKDIEGKLYKGILEADSLDAFYRALRERGQFCLTVRETGGRGLGASLGGPRLRLGDLSVFLRQLSTMISAGLPVIKCLDILQEQAAKGRFKGVVAAVGGAVQKGGSLSAAMRAQKGVFPPLLLNMVEAGEASGTLDKVLARLADQYEKEAKTAHRVQQALTYPALVAALMVVVVAGMLVLVLPRFVTMLGQFGGRLPLPTRILLGASSFLRNHWCPLAGVLLAAVVVGRCLLRDEKVRIAWDRCKLRMPVFGKPLATLAAARFARTLSTLLGSGMPVVQSIDLVAKTLRNAYLKSRLFQVGEEVRRGISLSASVRRQGIFPPMLSSMLGVGEESGKMEEILAKTAAFYDGESKTALQRLVTLIEPLLIVVLAVTVGLMILAIMMPVFSLYSQISAEG